VSGEIGIGAGIVVNGELVRGERGFGGELGHLTISPDGPACHCGGRGCLEQYAGQDAIRLAAGRPPPPDGHPAGVADFVALAEAGNLPMRNALQHAGEALGVAIAGLVNLLDLGTVVLGGSFAALEPWLRRPVEHEVGRRVLSARWTPVRIEASVLGGDAAVRGAAGAVLRAIYENPAGWIV
jgi:predicted NBD/HSP70 family sugar kinase